MFLASLEALLLLLLLLTLTAGVRAAEDGRVSTTFVIIEDENATGTGTGTGTGAGSNSTPAPTTEVTPEHTTTQAEQQQQEEADIYASRATRGAPFNFTNVFLVGGSCSDSSDWSSKVMQGGIKTLQDQLFLTKHICAKEEEGAYFQYSDAFHFNALQEIQQLVGHQVNSTLVITAYVEATHETFWPLLGDLLLQGMTYLGFIVEFNFTKHGFSPDQVSAMAVGPDEDMAPELAGRELCRVMGSNIHLKVATYKDKEVPRLDRRIDIALAAFKKSCPDTEYEIVWEYYVNKTDPMRAPLEPAFQLNPFPDVIMAFNDFAAQDVLLTAQNILSKAEYDRLVTTGYDNALPELVETHKILTTIDLMVFYANLGYWKTVSTIFNSVQNYGLRSTTAIQHTLGLTPQTFQVLYDTKLISSDPMGFLLSNLLEAHDTRAAPSRQVNVSTGIHEVTVVEFVPFDGYFEAVLWIQWTWYDQRLAWDEYIYSQSITVERELIWWPQLYFSNQFETTELFVAPAILKHTGQVTLELNLRVKFLCSTTKNLRSFPFDKYTCAMNLAGYTGLLLDHNLGFELMETDSEFDTVTFINMTFHNGTNRQHLDTEAKQEILYQFVFVRKPFTAYVRLILPAVIINMIGFMAFWIPNAQESVALGITSMLCTIAYRQTVDMPNTSDITWTEVFMMVNIAYQASVMFIIFLSYNYVMRDAVKRWNRQAQDFFHRQRLHYLKRQASNLKLQYNKMLSMRNLHNPRNKQNERHIPSNDMVATEEDREMERLKEQIDKIQSQYREGRRKLLVPADDDSDGSDDVDSWGKEEGEDKDEEEIVVEPESYNASTEGDENTQQLRRRNVDKKNLRMSWLQASGTNGGGVPFTIHESQEKAEPPKTSPKRGILDISRRDSSHRSLFGGKPAETGPVADFSANVDWIGRWFIVPSYVVVMMTLFMTGWGFFFEDL